MIEPSLPGESQAAKDSFRVWMNEAAHLHARENILMHRLCFDMQLAAARHGYYLNTYYDDVDHDGFDLIFDDQDTIKKTQVKTVDSKAATGQWGIHKRILRPSFAHIEKLGFEPSPVGEGVEGGFILMQFDASVPDLAVKYFYTDLYVWLAFECGIIRRADGRSQKAVETCLAELRTGSGTDRLAVPWALLLQAKGPDELLALSGLHSRAGFSWVHHVFQIANNLRANPHRRMQLSQSLPAVKRLAADQIGALVVDPDLVNGGPGEQGTLTKSVMPE
jgi:hypothetical protein